MHLKIKRSAPMCKLFLRTARGGASPASTPNADAGSMEMEDMDVIDAVLPQIILATSTL